MSEDKRLFGMKVVEDDTVPPTEVRFVDPATDRCVGKIVNVAPMTKPGTDVAVLSKRLRQIAAYTGILLSETNRRSLIEVAELLTSVAARDTHWRAWLAREGISYDKGPDGMPKGWGKR